MLPGDKLAILGQKSGTYYSLKDATISGYSYYLDVNNATLSNGELINVPSTSVWTLGGESGQWTFQCDDYLYVYENGTHTNIGIAASPSGGTDWSFSFNGTVATVESHSYPGFYMGYSNGTNYKEFAVYNTSSSSSDRQIYLYKQYKTADEYSADFLSQTSEVCKTNNQTDVDDLTTLWGKLSAQFAYLTTSSKAVLKQSNNAAMQRYDYIVSKYHFEDFIDRQGNGEALAGEKVIYSTGIALAGTIVASLAIVGGFAYFQKKRRENAE